MINDVLFDTLHVIEVHNMNIIHIHMIIIIFTCTYNFSSYVNKMYFASVYKNLQLSIVLINQSVSNNRYKI